MQKPWERDNARKSLAQQYWVSEWTISSLIAHETMRRAKKLEWSLWNSQEWAQDQPTQTIQKSTQARVYTITLLSEITEEMRSGIFQDFTAVIQDNATNTRYDFYIDIEAISDYYNIDPTILEQFLRNRYNWLWGKLDELKKWKAISEEEKMSIRLYVEAWIDNTDKKSRRKEMAQRYGVSTYVISAITAWKLTENWEKILGKDNPLIAKTPNRASRWWVDWVMIWKTILPLEQISPRDSIDWEDASLEEVFSGEDTDFIRELASEFNLNDDSQRTVFLQDIFDLFPDSTIDDIKKILRDFPDDITHTNTKRSGEGMWALVNYNNEIKNKWRQKLKEFIDANTDTEKRKDMKVLCLPWIECLEIPLYLELWFRPENIIGVEAWIVKWKKDPEIIALFQANASRYWIQTRIWKLEKVLETEDTVFDVVSLDFLGPISLPSRIIAQKLRLSDRATIATNYLNRREGDFWKMQLSASVFPKVINSNPNYRDILNTITMDNSKQMNAPSWDERSDSHHVVVLKQFTVESWKVPKEVNLQLLKFRKIDHSTIPYKKENVDLVKFCDGNIYNFILMLDVRPRILEMISAAFEATWLQNVWDEKQREYVVSQIGINLSKINALIQDLILSDFMIDAPNKSSYKYIGNKNSPMYSDFFVVQKLSQKEKAPFKKSLSFLVKCTEYILSGPIIASSISIRRKNRNSLVFDFEDEIVLKNAYGIEITSIKLRNLENARFEWKKLYWISQYEPPTRVMIR